MYSNSKFNAEYENTNLDVHASPFLPESYETNNHNQQRNITQPNSSNHNVMNENNPNKPFQSKPGFSKSEYTLMNEQDFYGGYYSPPEDNNNQFVAYSPQYSHTHPKLVPKQNQHKTSIHGTNNHQLNDIQVIQTQFGGMQIHRNSMDDSRKFKMDKPVKAKSVPDLYSHMNSFQHASTDLASNPIKMYDTETLLGYHRRFLNKMKIYYGIKYLDTMLKSNPSAIAIDCEGTDGKYHPALIQIAVDSMTGVIEPTKHDLKKGKLNCDCVYVFKLNRTILHHIHKWLLHHSNMIKVVFAGKDDTKTFPGIKNVVDIQPTIQKLWSEKYGVNLAKCYGFECCNGIFLRKNKSLTTSNWFAKSLSWDQIEYAALDAWVTLELYFTLLKKFFTFVD